MSWLQIKINCSQKQAWEFESALQQAGALSVTFEDQADQPILEPGVGETPLWQQTRVVALFPAEAKTDEITDQLASILGESFKHRWEILEDKDWEREWMQHYHPIQCGKKLWICPSWQPPPIPQAVNLMLDPGLAFGTGTHPTTFLCLQWLDSLSLEGQSVIDYGCGSGILAIAALLLGAEKAVCIDNDPQALLATTENARRNQIPEHKIFVYLPDHFISKESSYCDVVVANILAGPLISLAKSLAKLTRPGGLLCLSGLIGSQASQVMDAYITWFDFDQPVLQEEWVRLTAKRNTQQVDG